MTRIDLNCDLGEGGGHDAELMPLITSANIACGGHAGDEATMRETVALARAHGVGIGAHPGFADRQGFGRRELPASPTTVHRLVHEQVTRLHAIVRGIGARLGHVKLHGALYGLAARDPRLATAAVAAVAEIDRRLVMVGPAGSALIDAGRARGLAVAREVFADRTYQADGSLTPRSRPDALITDGDAACAQVLRIVREGRVRATDGTDVAVCADTICLHGDGADPVGCARRVRIALAACGIEIEARGP